MTTFAACTIVAHNYLPLARVLAESFRRFHPEASFTTVVIDRPAEAQLIRDPNFDVLPITDIDFGEGGFADMATIYDVTEFATSVKPFALRHLLGEHDCVIYLDPDIKLFAPLDPLIDATVASGWSVTPHCLKPIARDGTGPTERDIMEAGVYNLGYVGVTRAAMDFVDWWAERLRRDAIIDHANHLFTDQRWIDLAVPIFAPHIERRSSYNVAYWNIDQRRLWRDGDTLMVDDDVLRFFHFSGYDPAVPHQLTKHQPHRPRALLRDLELVGDLCRAYGEEVSRHRGSVVEPYGWDEAMPGVVLTTSIRRLFRNELLDAERHGTEPPPSPFRPDGVDRFRQWLLQTPAHDPRRLPRFLGAVVDERDDVRRAFPEIAWGDLDNFRTWVRDWGQYEHDIIRLLGAAWMAEPRRDDLHTGRSPDGVDVVGYLQAELGLGEAGRLLVSGLRAAGLEVAPIACRLTVSRQEHDFTVVDEACHDTVIVSVTADQLGHVRHDLGASFFEGRYVIGHWFWELEEFPDHLTPAFGMVDEVWAPTEFIRAAIAARAPHDIPVHRVPLPIMRPDVADGVHKESFGLDERFTFLFMFDFLSILERKNPIGLVRAFTQAFAPDEGPVLVLKSINGNERPDALERLRRECHGRNDIVVMDGYLDAPVNAALIAACDCYVSLHRSEGLGLTMAEAMTLGKPVIATAYSGNTDFMADERAVLVPWTRVAVGANAGPYPATATWAEPDLGEAALAMRRVVEDPVSAQRLGAAGARYLADHFDPLTVGTIMQQRLEATRMARDGR